MFRLRRLRNRPYALAVIVVTLAALGRWALDPLLHEKAQLLLFACGVVVAALYGKLRAGITATVLAIPVCDYLFIEPRYTFFIYDAPGDAISLGLFLLLGVGVSVTVEGFHRTRERLRQTARDLEQSELRLRTLAASVPETLFTATALGEVDYVSETFCEYTGYDAARARRKWLEAVHPEDRAGLLSGWRNSVESGEEFRATFRLQRSDGEYRWFKSHATPVRADNGAIAKWAGVCADIHDQKLLEETLARRTEELAFSNEEFQRFAYRVSHDLKEPLRMIGMFSELLLRRNEATVDGESRTCLQYIIDGVRRIENQMRDLLDYATAGSLEVRRELLDFNTAVDSAIANLQPLIRETGAAVTHDVMPVLVANPERVRSIFQNLIGNALKYRSAAPPRVHVSARVDGDEWLFAVEDNGLGFEMAEAERIFNAFERASSNPKVSGTGLGLAIVKRIVERQRGRVWAESEPEKGSKFFFTLPRSMEKAPADEARSGREFHGMTSAQAG